MLFSQKTTVMFRSSEGLSIVKLLAYNSWVFTLLRVVFIWWNWRVLVIIFLFICHRTIIRRYIYVSLLIISYFSSIKTCFLAKMVAMIHNFWECWKISMSLCKNETYKYMFWFVSSIYRDILQVFGPKSTKK